jgi:hypothetical protein
MAFDQTTRNRLQKFVSRARDLLADEFTRQLQNDYGMDPDTGTISDIDRLTHLDDATASDRCSVAGHPYPLPGIQPGQRYPGDSAPHCPGTGLYRAESAERPAHGRSPGYSHGIHCKRVQSKGFQLYTRVWPVLPREISEIPIETICSACLMNSPWIWPCCLTGTPPWAGCSQRNRFFWICLILSMIQILNTCGRKMKPSAGFTSISIPKKNAKKCGMNPQAPRNSRELAVRNQFFTPRYVVEFLTDNTLGRIWYEMTQGHTALKESVPLSGKTAQ